MGAGLKTSPEEALSLTAEVTVKRLLRACEHLSNTPKDMVERAKSDLTEFQAALEDKVAAMEEGGKAPGYSTSKVS